MFDSRSIHAAATEKVAALAAETAKRGAIESAYRGAKTRARNAATLFWALRLLTP